MQQVRDMVTWVVVFVADALSFTKGFVFLAIPDASRIVSPDLVDTVIPKVHIKWSSFQQALYRNVSEKNAQLEKRLENVIREGATIDFAVIHASFVGLSSPSVSQRGDQPVNEQDGR